MTRFSHIMLDGKPLGDGYGLHIEEEESFVLPASSPEIRIATKGPYVCWITKRDPHSGVYLRHMKLNPGQSVEALDEVGNVLEFKDGEGVYREIEVVPSDA